MYAIWYIGSIWLFYRPDCCCTNSGKKTIRTSACMYLVPEAGRCFPCAKHRHTLHAILHRLVQSKEAKSSPTNSTSTTNLRYLTTPQKITRFRQLRLSFKQNQSQLERLRAKLRETMEKRSAEVDRDLHQDLIGKQIKRYV